VTVQRASTERIIPTVQAVARAIAASGRPWMIIGGVAARARGSVRSTSDVDVTVAAQPSDAKELVALFEQQRIVRRPEDPPPEPDAPSVVLRHAPTDTQVIVSFARTAFELEAIEHAPRVFYHGVRVPIVRAEDLVIYKTVTWRPQDRIDVAQVLLMNEDIDVARVRRIVGELCTLLGEPERLADLDDILARTPRLQASRPGQGSRRRPPS
jgi:hypothetical protein